MTGLALLAFLASGQTHRDGPHTADVRRGLEYLLSVQAADGNLAGKADVFARMYSHAMAAFALSEAYAMTGDARLRDGVRRAVAYTRRRTGRLRRRLAISARRSRRHQPTRLAMDGPEERRTGRHSQREPTRQGIMRFLRSVASGSYGGLASYRPGEQPTRTMTAEALVCWQFLGMAREDPASNEAGDYLLGQLPGQGAATSTTGTTARWRCTSCRATLGSGGTQALQTQLLATQRKSGPKAGSWDPDAIWGGYGGRSTARRSRRSAWRSTTASCRCIRRWRRSKAEGGGRRGKAEQILVILPPFS